MTPKERTAARWHPAAARRRPVAVRWHPVAARWRPVAVRRRPVAVRRHPVAAWMRARLRVVGSGDDSGQLPTALMTLVFVGLVMVIFLIALPLGQATDLRSGAQSAADAAALAAADQVQEDLVADLGTALDDVRTRDDLRGLLSFMGAGYGMAGAGDYAGRNQAELTGYAFSRLGGLGPGGGGQIRVTVQGRPVADQSTGGRAAAVAYAKLGLRLGECELDDDATPTTTPPDPDPDPEPTDPDAEPPPPPDIGTELRCGELVLRFTIRGVDGRPRLDSDLSDLEDQFDIALSG